MWADLYQKHEHFISSEILSLIYYFPSTFLSKTEGVWLESLATIFNRLNGHTGSLTGHNANVCCKLWTSDLYSDLTSEDYKITLTRGKDGMWSKGQNAC